MESTRPPASPVIKPKISPERGRSPKKQMTQKDKLKLIQLRSAEKKKLEQMTTQEKDKKIRLLDRMIVKFNNRIRELTYKLDEDILHGRTVNLDNYKELRLQLEQKIESTQNDKKALTNSIPTIFIDPITTSEIKKKNEHENRIYKRMRAKEDELFNKECKEFKAQIGNACMALGRQGNQWRKTFNIYHTEYLEKFINDETIKEPNALKRNIAKLTEEINGFDVEDYFNDIYKKLNETIYVPVVEEVKPKIKAYQNRFKITFEGLKNAVNSLNDHFETLIENNKTLEEIEKAKRQENKKKRRKKLAKKGAKIARQIHGRQLRL